MLILRRYLHSADSAERVVADIAAKYVERTKSLEPDLKIKSLPKIKAGFTKRYKERYLVPSKQWLEKKWKDGEGTGPVFSDRPQVFSESIINSKILSEKVKQYEKMKKFSFNPADLMKNSLDKGDIVLLKQAPRELAMCVNLPVSTADPRYTFAKIDGTIIYALRSSVLLRIPGQLPPGVDQLILPEHNHKYEKIGTVKNSISELELLPTVARQLVVSYTPSFITKFATDQLPIVLKKLELLHRYLQDPLGAWHITFISLTQLIKSMNVAKATDAIGGDKYMQELIATYMENTIERIDPSNLLSTYLAIKEQQQQNLWGSINRNSALCFPTSVAVLPLQSSHIYYEEVICKLKAKNFAEIHRLAKCINTHDYKTINAEYKDVINLLKNYAAGNFDTNVNVSTLISKLFRLTNKYMNRDITRELCDELLYQISPDIKNKNLILNNVDLELPDSSIRATNEQRLYEMTAVSKINDTARYDFGDLPVYCIDSEVAHEIDDGISIEKLSEDKYRIYVHVADPASLFPESSNYLKTGIMDDILKISLRRGFTSYLPELVHPMLPESYCRATDLGNEGKKTNTITFSLELDIYGKRKVNIDKKSFKVQLGQVSRFPSMTYERVDRILRREEEGVDPIDYDNLLALSDISKRLQYCRALEDNAVIFGEGFNRGMVQLQPDEHGNLTRPTFYDQNQTDSTILVSEFMLLANSQTGRFFKKNKIPGIYRCYRELNLGPVALNQYMQLQKQAKNGKLPELKDITKISALLNSSFYSSRPYPHDMIGAKFYMQVTSPMRRGPDLINHLQLHRYLKKLPLCFNQDQIDAMVWPIQSRADIIKDISQRSAVYWTLKHLEANEADQPHTVIVTSVPQDGTVRCVLPKYSMARGTLLLTPRQLETAPKIGDTVRACKIDTIYPLDGILTLVTPET
ncbi:hypothetical protein RNJ44_02241 [Nakaseomyces bracarensis]|uniref:RNB domain-containing protein n=1 Tax=Nakaseomyces bracarensis TaxID=273131 RepID=A0ABR4NN15_9SACH